MTTLTIEIKHTGIKTDQQLVDIIGNTFEMIPEDIYESIKILPASQDKGVCKWKMDSEQYGYPNCYDRGQTFLTTDAKYCPFCGLKIERV